MARLRVRNFGPLNDNTDWIDLTKLTMLVGGQGTGKSTLAKLVSTFMWMEKSLLRGDHNVKYFTRKGKFKKACLEYHRIENYLRKDSCIEYSGDSFDFKYSDEQLCIVEVSPVSELPKIIYTPAERNFLTSISSFKELRVSSPELRDFRDVYQDALQALKQPLPLPIADVKLEYDKLNDTLNLRGNGYKLKIRESASGFQSFAPLYVVTRHLAESVSKSKEQNTPMTAQERKNFMEMISEIANDSNLTDQQRVVAISALSKKFTYSAFINIVEEPEQNLYPKSQWLMLMSLLAANNLSEGNRLIVTTHSPYLINFLPTIVMAHRLYGAIGDDELRARIAEIVPPKSMISGDEIGVYQIGDDGIYSRLEDYKGMPSDDNFLNNLLEDSNIRFSQLLQIKQDARLL